MRLRVMRTRSAGGGFTLLEVLVAIGVLTFVAVAIATIFDAIGDTLSRGKRISELNQFAARIESVMRKDFESMSRDGFLVIRHEYANGGKPIPLFEGDADPKPRRVDQMMFFATGEFSSSRRDIYAGLTPTSGEARIYYGHGQRRTEDFRPGSLYLKPDIRDTLVGRTPGGSDFRDDGARLGLPSTPGLPNPNEYAADWSLLRHVTVLAPAAPELAQMVPDYSNGGIFGYGANRDAVTFAGNETRAGIQRKVVVDRPYQIALQPAITSIFWNAQPFRLGTNLDRGDIEPVPNPVKEGYGYTAISQARFTSGLVDVATTDLAEIESVVTSGAFEINNRDSDIVNRLWYSLYLQWDHTEEALIVPNGPAVNNFPKRYPFTVTSPAQQRAWMINALPTHPAERLGQVEIGDPLFGRTSPRIRYEVTPPNLPQTLIEGGTTPNKRLASAYESADQEMLTRSVFVPRCTQFILEWTYGEVYDDYSDELSRVSPNLGRAALVGSIADLGSDKTSPRALALRKKFVWYGRDGWAPAPDGGQVDLDGDGNRNYDPDDRTTFFYSRALEGRQNISPRNVEDAMKRNNQSQTNRRYVDQDFPIRMAEEEAKDPLHIVGREAALRPDDSTETGRRMIETATFGYYVYNPGVITQNTVDDLIINWPWPKLIRVTFWLADPTDPGIETSYQVVFEVPSREAG